MKKLQLKKSQKFEWKDVDLKDVNYIDKWQRSGHSMAVLAYHTTNGSYHDLDILAEAAAALKDEGFIMVGRTALVQEEKIEKIQSIENNGSVITFKDGTQLHVLKQM
ncbi:LytTR family transcriptional regulator DNA-binding domain-containing protein [Paenibacillus sp. DMB5]|uniref:LytTR family transcriptional regulator DNA-binding domain-containing protein n=1 Tax=Paenibacillus sp. DMB5 TaxID=1780103 RepID=UPI0012FFC4B7|nr:LytTR family transcriptional regulator DNA-binding domain-containing protein [Paenibacillus sp. DMB5]